MKTYRTCVYVDGFNFAHTMDQKKSVFRRYPILRVPTLWKLCSFKLESFSGQEYDLKTIYLFTALAKLTDKNIHGQDNQKKHINYLVHGKDVRPIYGKQVRWRGKIVEKCSDVNLAIQLLNDAWEEKYDYAVIISNDTDFTGAIKMVRRQFPEKIIDVWTVSGTDTAKDLRKAANRCHQITDTELLKSIDVDMLKENLDGTELQEVLDMLGQIK